MGNRLSLDSALVGAKLEKFEDSMSDDFRPPRLAGKYLPHGIESVFVTTMIKHRAVAMSF
jgi:hypothetical protein